MTYHRNGELKRSVMSALAAVLAAAVPSLMAHPAFAEKPAGRAPASVDIAAREGAKPEAKRVKKVPAAKKEAAKKEVVALPERKKPELAKAKAEAKVDVGQKPKKTASRAPAKGKKTAKKADQEAPARRCPGTPIVLDRTGLERQSLALLDCHGRPVESARESLSILARPWGAQKPARLASSSDAARPLEHPSAGRIAGNHGGLVSLSHAAVARAPGELAPGVRLLDKGLLTRLGAVARRFPGKPISLVSGYRPQSRGSLHQSGRALDLRVVGVANEELVAFCKTLADTGCGYYPNSSFVHLDVRTPGSGGATWIDASGPGEPPHYVHRWPPRAEDADGAVLAEGAQPHDGSTDPWTIDPVDEHAADHEPAP